MPSEVIRLSKEETGGERVLHAKQMSNWLDPEEVRSLTVAEVLARVDALKPLIAANAREAELRRQPVDEVWAAIRRTGVFYLSFRRNMVQWKPVGCRR